MIIERNNSQVSAVRSQWINAEAESLSAGEKEAMREGTKCKSTVSVEERKRDRVMAWDTRERITGVNQTFGTRRQTFGSILIWCLHGFWIKGIWNNTLPAPNNQYYDISVYIQIFLLYCILHGILSVTICTLPFKSLKVSKIFFFLLNKWVLFFHKVAFNWSKLKVKIVMKKLLQPLTFYSSILEKSITVSTK